MLQNKVERYEVTGRVGREGGSKNKEKCRNRDLHLLVVLTLYFG